MPDAGERGDPQLSRGDGTVQQHDPALQDEASGQRERAYPAR